MKYSATTTISATILLALASVTTLPAGQAEIKAPVEMIAAPESAPSPWELTITPYGWGAGLNGTTGVKGYTTETDVGLDQILEHLDMVLMMQVDLRYNRWMLLLDGQYMKLSAEAQPEDRILSSANAEVEQIMLEAAVGYRLLDGEDGYLDVFAGARYISLDVSLGLTVNSAVLEDQSEKLSAEIIDRVGEQVRRAAAPAVAAAKSAASEKAFDLRDRERDRIVGDARDRILDRIPGIIDRPGIIEGIRENDRIRDAIRDLVEAKTEAKAAEIKDTVQSAVQQAKSRLRARAERAVAKAEKRLAKEIQTAIEEAIPDNVSGKADWVDPIVGIRGRWNFAKPCYLTGRADIGGFGVGSDFTYQLYAALGCQVSRNVSIELGYRNLYVDYTDGGFVYDMSTSGVVSAFQFSF